MNKKAIKILRFCYSVVLLIERYYSMLEKILRFETLHETRSLMFGVSNAKNLAFGTLDANALTILRLKVWSCFPFVLRLETLPFKPMFDSISILFKFVII